MFLQAKLLNLASLIRMEGSTMENAVAYGITCRNHKELYGWPTETAPFPFLIPPLEFLPLKMMVIKLKLLDENGKVHWSFDTETSLSTGMVMKLMDSWNLVLSDNISGEIL